MVAATLISLRQNKKQLNEIKRQWNEEQRPRLNISVIISQHAYYVKICNSGRSNAYNIQLSINDDFISYLEDKHKEVFFSLQSTPFFIEAGESKYFFIGFCEDIIKMWKGKNVLLNIKGEYCNKYTIDETLYMSEFVDKLHFVVNDELTTMISYIKKGLIVQNDQYYPIQKSLDIIAKQITQINQNRKENE